MNHDERLAYSFKNWLNSKIPPTEKKLLDILTDHLDDFNEKADLRRVLTNYATHLREFLKINPEIDAPIDETNITTKKEAGEQLLKAMTSFLEEFFLQSAIFGTLGGHVFHSSLKLLLSKLVGISISIYSVEGGNVTTSMLAGVEPLMFRVQRLILNYSGACIVDKVNPNDPNFKTLFAKSKRSLLLFIDSQRIKISLKIKQINIPLELKNNLLKTKQLNITDFPVSERVSFRFHVGRVELFNFQFSDAFSDFQFAYKECSSKVCFENKKNILKFLIFTKLSFGIYPSQALLNKFSLQNSIGSFVKSCKLGNIKEFDNYVQQNFINLSKCGFIGLIHRARRIAFRNLMRRIFLAHPADSPTRYQIKLPMIQNLCKKVFDFEISVDELECNIVNLKNEGMISGMIHHPSQTLVLTKDKTVDGEVIKTFPSSKQFC